MTYCCEKNLSYEFIKQPCRGKLMEWNGLSNHSSAFRSSETFPFIHEMIKYYKDHQFFAEKLLDCSISTRWGVRVIKHNRCDFIEE